MYVGLTDEEIIRQVFPIQPNRCFEALYNRHVIKVHRHCSTIIHDVGLAQDSTHDIFIKIFTGLHHFKHKAKFSTWLYTVTHNHCVDQIRHQKRLSLELTDKFDWPDIIEQEQIDIEEERLYILKKSIDMLSPTERILLQLRYEEAQSIEKIARLHGLSQSAIKMRLKRIRQKLKHLYDQYS